MLSEKVAFVIEGDAEEDPEIIEITLKAINNY